MDFLHFILLVAAGLFLWQWRGARGSISGLRDEAKRLLDEKQAIFELLRDLADPFGDSTTREARMKVILGCATQATQAEAGAVFELNPAKREMKLITLSGIFPPLTECPPDVANKIATKADRLEAFIRATPMDAEKGVLAEALQKGELIVSDANGDARFPVSSLDWLQHKSFLAVCLQYHNEKYGVLVVTNRKHGFFSSQDLEILKAVGGHAAYALHNMKVSKQLAEKERLDRDIEVARQIQRVLLPQARPEVAGYDLSALYVPAREVSGDYYDFIPLENGCLGVAIADVSGKGVPASLVMTMCRTILRDLGSTGHSISAALTLRELNRRIFPDIREDMFITMIYLILNPATGFVSLARAGHEAPLHWKQGRVETLRPQGMALGMDSGEVFDMVMEEMNFRLEKGDALILYTDGVTEATDAAGREFGLDSLREAIEVSATGGADAIVVNLAERLDRFIEKSDKYDDVTMVSICTKNTNT